MINIVLVEPEIPQNAGNIIRTCACIGAKLFMVRPLGFILDDKHFKRSAMDYVDIADVTVVNSFGEIVKKFNGSQFYFASTKASKTYADVPYPDNSVIVFGKESYGLSENLLKKHYEDCIRIPMSKNTRSLNLANSVAIIAYEAMRKQGFEGLQTNGELSGRLEDDEY